MNLRDMTKDDLLHMIGLESRRSQTEVLLPMVGVFSAGLLLGAGLGLLLAPKSGAEIRGDIASRTEDLRRRLPVGAGEEPRARSATNGSTTRSG